ncbi:hypothetical protein KZP52_003363 [Salmonella enterica]|uniref:hypothetical protein n=1 Tax=Salmonella enterica TaxID=28901 RepID=UPI001CBD670B|nr:hypothetical protein [Salmonella enterica]EKQ9928350.1 hypothetical protein [Salmonella enterica subsp. enterica serovar Panama]EHU8214391.1 hypothetical protein [Salmonella enterica]EIE5010575.1 hypothetical protein [Salmonella enterica]EJC4644934.1 hypothetical protein [Salmonella enterica]EJE2439747.1 hypothetical protein [Salmonella enterica]
MTKEYIENANSINEETLIQEDSIVFISTEEDEQEGNFEFLCCRGGMSPGGGGIGGHW